MRTVLDYATGPAPESTVTLFRSAPANPPAWTVLPVHRQVSSDRGARFTYHATFQYTEPECGACVGADLVVYSSPTGASGPWAPVPVESQDLSEPRNDITVLRTFPKNLSRRRV